MTVNGGIASDDFNAFALNPMWTFEDPVGDSRYEFVGAGTADALLLLFVPAGTSHDVWTGGNRSARAMQSAQDEDFQIEVKFESEPTQRYQIQGMLVEQDANNFLRFDVYSDGAALHVFAATFSNGVPSTVFDQTISSAPTTYLRLTRVGDEWTAQYADDGSTWTTAGIFTHTLAVSTVGVFAGNTGNNPAFTAAVDYFFDTAAPIAPEDGLTCAPNDQFTLSATVVGDGAVSVSPEQQSYLCGDQVTLTATPGTDSMFVDWSGDVRSSTNPLVLLMIANLDVTANFVVNTGAPVIDVWYGPSQKFGNIGIPQQWVNVLGNVADDDGIASVTYSLNGGADQPLSTGPDNRRLAEDGDFIVEVDYQDLDPGFNDVTITATDSGGSTSVEVVDIDVTTTNVWPLPYTIDWASVVDVQDVLQVVDGQWYVGLDGIRTDQVGYDRLLVIGDITWQSYEITVPITIHHIGTGGPVSGAPGVGLILRWIGHTDSPVVCSQFHCGWLPSGPIAWWRNDNLSLDSAVDPSVVLAIGVRYFFKLRVEAGQTGDLYSLKVWEDGQSEPINWNLQVTRSLGDTTNGSALLVAHHMDVTFGDVTLVPVN